MFVPIRIIIRQDFPQLLLPTNSEKNLLIWMLMSSKKKVCFDHLFWYEERQERRNREPAVSLMRTGSAEQAQFFSVFRSKGGKREATMKCESRSRRSEKKIHEKTTVTRRTGAMFCVFPTNRGKHDALRFCWKIFVYHMIFTNQFDRNSGSVGSIFFCALPSRSPNACLRSPMRRKKITPVLQARQGVAWHSRQQVID